MQDINTNTYPNEPANPNEYVGFNKSVYYLLNLLREMFFSKTESENKFFPKTGGVIGGNLTIQGNLVVNGNSYKIDTTDLNVQDYTITLAKDNTQALTSMVGMVVPKYDGTNYGFFGWDADGYAYVGDLTNYDGSSAITLANNSSLQRIATIDAASLTTTSNGKVMIWDEVSHTFKVAPNGTYVIKNGRLVQGYDKDDIDDALANLQPFDVLTDQEIEDATEVIPPTTGLVNPIVDLIYPIGSIYMSISSTSPSTLFGGTWVSLGTGYIPLGDVPVITKTTTHSVLDGSNFAHLKFKDTDGVSASASNRALGLNNGQLTYGTAATLNYEASASITPSNLWVDNTKNASSTEYSLPVYMWKRTA